MKQPVRPTVSYAGVELSGPPETVARMMTALGEAGEIIFDHRAEPDVRGNVLCTARVAVVSPSPAPSASGTVKVVVQSTLRANAARQPGLDEMAGAEEFEAEVATAIDGLAGVEDVRSRVVAVTRLPGPPAG